MASRLSDPTLALTAGEYGTVGFVTFGDLLTELLAGRKVGDAIEYAGVRFEVTSVSGHGVASAIVEVLPDKQVGTGPPARVSVGYYLGIDPDSRMKGRLPGAKLVLATSLALSAPGLWAQAGFEGAVAQANFAAAFGPALAVADLDRDCVPDGAVVVASGRLRRSNNLRIELHLSGRDDTDLTFESIEIAHTVAARDIDADGDIDVLVEQPLTQQLLQVWLNDGRGGFHKGRIEEFPSASVPTGERLKPHPDPRDRPALSLPLQRGFQTVMLAARHLPGRRSTTGRFEAPSTTGSPAARAFAQDAARAPPLLRSH